MATSFLAVDAGTTNIRVWLVEGGRVRARAEAAAGARDTAREGHDGKLRAALRSLLAQVRGGAKGRAAPTLVAAAGMITSPQGLHEVPHLAAPAGVAELAAAAQQQILPDVCDLPILFVPGVRTNAIPGVDRGIGATDVMRGEETLAAGLHRQRVLAAGGALLNVGSHWKLIRLDEAGRVAWSLTSLSGEMMQAVRGETILASAVPAGPLADPDVPLLLEGMDEARRSGLSRALFCVRLLELASAADGSGRSSFLLGAFIGADLDALQTRRALPPGTPVTITGGENVGRAWAMALDRAGCPARSLGTAETEAGFLAGLRAVVDARRVTAE